LCQLTSKSVHLFSKYRVDKLGETNERMDERTDGRENIMTPPVSLSLWRDIKRKKTVANRECSIYTNLFHHKLT